jgi:HPr kinase/phosphorylase
MRVHASCAARPGPNGYEAILLIGPTGAGKSDMLLRLIHAGWVLVADDQVLVERGVASAPTELAGILEVRGLGLFRLPFLKSASLRMVVRLGVPTERLPQPEQDGALDLPVISVDVGNISAVERVSIALDAACGRVLQIAGAFAM